MLKMTYKKRHKALWHFDHGFFDLIFRTFNAGQNAEKIIGTEV